MENVKTNILDWLRASDLHDRGDFTVTTMHDEPFVIMAGWEAIQELTKQYNADFDTDFTGEYSTDILDENGIEWGFNDEYDTCSCCYKGIRTSPSSYSWKPDYWYDGDFGLICNECFNGYENIQEQYLHEHINNPNKAIELLSERQLEELGFVKVNRDSYQSGLHQGMNDDPKAIFDSLQDKYEEIVFTISMRSQFYIEFEVFGRNKEE